MQQKEAKLMVSLLKRPAVALAAVALCACASAANADDWNERTTLTFSEAVMVPEATLQPGTYEFLLMDPSSSRHIVQIRSQDGKIVTSATAVPTKRLDSKAQTVLKFSPTDEGVPPALKAWFYPGSLYGHEFVYPEDQARHIAERSKTIVLSIDVPGSDFQKGTLRTFDPSGHRIEWRGDEATMREWDQWRRNRSGRAMAQGATGEDRRQASAPMIQGDFTGMRVELDDLEENPQKYIGQTISVDGEVEEIIGPRLFTIDEANWGDLDGEILVFLPTTKAALVRNDDRITVTGTVKPFVRAEVEREWGWLGLRPEVEVEFSRKPVLIASRIAGGNNNVAMVIEIEKASEKPVGTGGGGSAVTSLSDVADADEGLVGRRVNLRLVTVDGVAQGGGFFIRSPRHNVFVLPAKPERVKVRVGDTVSIKGIILQMPDGIEDRVKATRDVNDDAYIYATSIHN